MWIRHREEIGVVETFLVCMDEIKKCFQLKISIQIGRQITRLGKKRNFFLENRLTTPKNLLKSLMQGLRCHNFASLYPQHPKSEFQMMQHPKTTLNWFSKKIFLNRDFF